MGNSTAFIFLGTISESGSVAVRVTIYFYMFVKTNENMIFTINKQKRSQHKYVANEVLLSTEEMEI